MAQVKVHYEPETDLLTVFWKEPRKSQICVELDEGVILIKDENSDEILGVEVLSYKSDKKNITGVSLEIGDIAV